MRFTTCTLAASIMLALTAPSAHAADFSFEGLLSDGPLAGQSFSGGFSYDDAALLAGFTGELPLTMFSLQIGGAAYGLSSADPFSTPGAAFDTGSFIGLSYSDSSAPDTAVRPHVAFVAGFTDLDQAYLSYVGAVGAAGFGSYAVTAVPEPASWGLLVAGLAAFVARVRRRRVCAHMSSTQVAATQRI